MKSVKIAMLMAEDRKMEADHKLITEQEDKINK
ncbi:hypothetical protein HDF25_003103 [Pedobacter cryoconitis]|uniref:Uncharacterized protein n=1 Tax=Pedobacter cryoconitis TaxID=188932 RepID=A0A7X0J4X8_9SPHI|nr:hypothetical protein [Pedobacter cryoconitis]